MYINQKEQGFVFWGFFGRKKVFLWQYFQKLASIYCPRLLDLKTELRIKVVSLKRNLGWSMVFTKYISLMTRRSLFFSPRISVYICCTGKEICIQCCHIICFIVTQQYKICGKDTTSVTIAIPNYLQKYIAIMCCTFQMFLIAAVKLFSGMVLPFYKSLSKSLAK